MRESREFGIESEINRERCLRPEGRQPAPQARGGRTHARRVDGDHPSNGA